MNIIRLQKWDDLVIAATEVATQLGGGIWYRGQCCDNPEWSIRPSTFRLANRHAEYNMSMTFRAMSPAIHSTVPAHDDLFGWLSLMQHHGLATRLLDWTETIFVAAYFAVAHQKQSGDAVIWALQPSQLNESQLGRNGICQETHDHVRVIAEDAFADPTAARSNEIIAVSPCHSNARLRAQSRHFTIHGSATPIEKLPGRDRFLAKIVVPEKLRAPIENVVTGAAGINDASLFPDLDHLARYISSMTWKHDDLG